VLTDQAVVAFEHATLDPATFGHREHLYVAWCYLRALPLEEALARYILNLRRITLLSGAPTKFHATMTWAYVVLLHSAMVRSPGADFDRLLGENPALGVPAAEVAQIRSSSRAATRPARRSPA
jgi:hypothetical protein